MRIQEGIGHFLFHCQYEKNLSEKTLAAYVIDLEQFRRFHQALGKGDGVEAVSKEVVRCYLKSLHQRYKPRSIKRKLASLKAFLNYLEYEDHISANPFRKLRIKIDKAKDLPRTISPAILRRLFETAYAERTREGSDNGRLPERRRDVAVLELLFATGMRVGELCGLNSADVDVESGSVLVSGKGGKQRRVPICPPKALLALSDYHAAFSELIERDGPFFVNRRGRRVTDQSVRLMLARLCESAGIPERVTPHMFRHTLATQLLENGVDIRFIQFLLGHSSISVTEIYARVNEKAQREVLERRHPRGGIYG